MEKLGNDFKERSDELRRFLLEAMVVMRPEERRSAEACHARAELLPIPMVGRYKTPTPASPSDESELTTIRYLPGQTLLKTHRMLHGRRPVLTLSAAQRMRIDTSDLAGRVLGLLC